MYRLISCIELAQITVLSKLQVSKQVSFVTRALSTVVLLKLHKRLANSIWSHIICILCIQLKVKFMFWFIVYKFDDRLVQVSPRRSRVKLVHISVTSPMMCRCCHATLDSTPTGSSRSRIKRTKVPVMPWSHCPTTELRALDPVTDTAPSSMTFKILQSTLTVLDCAWFLPNTCFSLIELIAYCHKNNDWLSLPIWILN